MLEKIIKHLIAEALTIAPKPAMHRTQAGLYISIRWSPETSLFTMILSREKSHPGTIEMRTCIGLLPDTVERPAASSSIETTYINRPSLRVQFTKVQATQEPMF